MNDTPLAIDAPKPEAKPAAPAWLIPALLAANLLLTGGAIAYAVMQYDTVSARLEATITESKKPQRLPDEQMATLKSLSGVGETVRALAAEQSQQSTEVATQLAALTLRLEEMEKALHEQANKKPSRHAGDIATVRQFMALKSAMQNGEPFADALSALQQSADVAPVMAPLLDDAETGIPTEATLRAQLTELLSVQPKAMEAKPRSLVARLNSQFEGMLHITKHAPSDAYRTLRQESERHATLESLIHEVEALPSEAREPLAAWLRSAQLREKADAVIAQIETSLLDEKPTP